MSKSSSSSSICSSDSGASTDGDGFDSSIEGSSSDIGGSSSSSSKGELEGELLVSPSAATPYHVCIEESNDKNKQWI
jgi:hypothetical protein